VTSPRIEIAERTIGPGYPTYFIADIAANHDGDLSRAVDLIHRAAEAGADAAKFQHFRAPKIVSRRGFESGPQLSHQSRWKKSVYEVYESASVPWDWTETLKRACDEAGIHFFSSPYDMEAVDMLDPYVPAFKIGSGDITWTDALEHMARTGKPLLLATGASDLEEVRRAVATIVAINPRLLLMQCNTNYTGSLENFRFVNLNVLRTFAELYPNLVLGLSDHTPGHATVLGAVALGASAVEKHFTDDRTREGPDHAFSMDPRSWREMVDRTRELEYALGGGRKVVEANEQETVVIQRRCLRAARRLPAGTVLKSGDLEPLRPAPRDAIFPYDEHRAIGRRLLKDLEHGDYPRWDDLA
jgi:N-acetylneuraminate synthase